MVSASCAFAAPLVSFTWILSPFSFLRVALQVPIPFTHNSALTMVPKPVSFPSPVLRRRLALCCLTLVVLLCLAGGCLPFVFESQSLFYKFGLDKGLLQWSKVLGIVAMVLLGLQLVLASRFKFLDRIFGLDRLLAFHRRIGMALLFLVSAHFTGILWSDGFAFFPLEKRYWPEFMGLGAGILLLGLVLTARFRNRLGLPYSLWKAGHGPLALMVTAMGTIHLLWVSDPFETGPLRPLGLAWAGLLLVLALGLLSMKWGRGRPVFSLSRIATEGKAVVRLDLSPLPPAGRLAFSPGQFAFIRPLAGPLAGEAHPFTIAASPSQVPGFTIRQCGDWTRQLSELPVGIPIRIDGPYGLFSHRAHPQADAFIFIAGGIGITPFYSMVHSMVETGESRPLTLVWSRKHPRDIGLPQDLDRLCKSLDRARIHHHFTRPDTGRGQRLTHDHLKTLVEPLPPRTHAFVCGPPPFYTAMVSALARLGLPRDRIHGEYFHF